MTQLDGIVLTPEGYLRGRIDLSNDSIAQISGTPVSEAEARDSGLPIHIPGFVDLHVHGGGGRDIMDAGDAAPTVARLHARFGTTAMLATTMTAPMEDIVVALRALAPHIANRPRQGARLLGVHLEGPYINSGKLGAQPDFTSAGTLDEFLALGALAPVRSITLAPEIKGSMELIPQLVKLGIRVQLGHSLASYEDGCHALECGAHGFTHLFNAMTGMHHRTPGLAGAALAHARYAEIIPDLLHVHPGAIRVALRAIPDLYCVSDSTAATGMPDGDYQLGRQRVTKCLGGVRLADGTLAGSTLTMDQALRNLVSLGLTLRDASRRTSTLPAAFLGLSDRGRLATGCFADIVTLDRDLEISAVHVEGERIER
jgi:N-acetylglucosamine-6-phosphate deacetylase